MATRSSYTVCVSSAASWHLRPQQTDIDNTCAVAADMANWSQQLITLDAVNLKLYIHGSEVRGRVFACVRPSLLLRLAMLTRCCRGHAKKMLVVVSATAEHHC